MRWPVAIPLALMVSGCGHKAEQPSANQSNTTENAVAESNAGGNANEASPSESGEANASANALGTLPASSAALRFVGRWARNESDCTTKSWVFTKEELTATDGPHCRIYNVKAVPGGYDLGALSRSMAALMPVLVGPTPGGEPVEEHPLAARALSRLSAYDLI